MFSAPPHVSNYPKACWKRNIGIGKAIRSDADFDSTSIQNPRFWWLLDHGSSLESLCIGWTLIRDFADWLQHFVSKKVRSTQDTCFPHPHMSQTTPKHAGNEILGPGKRFAPMPISIQNPKIWWFSNHNGSITDLLRNPYRVCISYHRDFADWFQHFV